MWLLCLAEDSLETSSLIFSEKQWKNIYECRLLQLIGILKVKINSYMSAFDQQMTSVQTDQSLPGSDGHDWT